MATYAGGYKFITAVAQYSAGNANNYGNGAGSLGTVPAGHFWIGTLIFNSASGAVNRAIHITDGTTASGAYQMNAANTYTILQHFFLGPGQRVSINGANGSDEISFHGAEFSA